MVLWKATTSSVSLELFDVRVGLVVAVSGFASLSEHFGVILGWPKSGGLIMA